MKTVYIHIHGTSSVSSWFANTSRKITHTFASDTMTRDTEKKLIPFAKGPSKVVESFKPMLQGLVHEDDQFFYQWSGILGKTAWREAALFLYIEIRDMLLRSNEDINVLFSAHSHGGTIARLVAELLLPYPCVKFHIVTLATPLSIKPLTVMPSNVISWLHIYHAYDMMQNVGTLFMKSLKSTDFPTTIEDIFKKSSELAKKNKPDTWLSHRISDMTIDPHNYLLGLSNMKDICQCVIDNIKRMQGMKSESTQTVPQSMESEQTESSITFKSSLRQPH